MTRRSSATLDEIDRLSPRGLALLLRLRAEHGRRPEPFPVAVHAYMAKVGWSAHTVIGTLRELVDQGELAIVRQGGKRVGEHSLYRLPESNGADEKTAPGSGAAPIAKSATGGNGGKPPSLPVARIAPDEPPRYSPDILTARAGPWDHVPDDWLEIPAFLDRRKPRSDGKF